MSLMKFVVLLVCTTVLAVRRSPKPGQNAQHLQAKIMSLLQTKPSRGRMDEPLDSLVEALSDTKWSNLTVAVEELLDKVNESIIQKIKEDFDATVARHKKLWQAFADADLLAHNAIPDLKNNISTLNTTQNDELGKWTEYKAAWKEWDDKYVIMEKAAEIEATFAEQQFSCDASNTQRDGVNCSTSISTMDSAITDELTRVEGVVGSQITTFESDRNDTDDELVKTKASAGYWQAAWKKSDADSSSLTGKASQWRAKVKTACCSAEHFNDFKADVEDKSTEWNENDRKQEFQVAEEINKILNEFLRESDETWKNRAAYEEQLYAKVIGNLTSDIEVGSWNARNCNSLINTDLPHTNRVGLPDSVPVGTDTTYVQFDSTWGFKQFRDVFPSVNAAPKSNFSDHLTDPTQFVVEGYKQIQADDIDCGSNTTMADCKADDQCPSSPA